MPHDEQCVNLARHFLRGYRLNAAERIEETGRLAHAIEEAVKAELEALEHRKVPA